MEEDDGGKNETNEKEAPYTNQYYLSVKLCGADTNSSWQGLGQGKPREVLKRGMDMIYFKHS